MATQAGDNWLSDEETNRPQTKRKRGIEHSKQSEDSKTRLRVTQACDTCRRRKDRCDGVRPSCSRCLSCGRDCQYKQSNKKRGLRSGYVRTLEILLGIIFDTVEGTEDWITSILANKTSNFALHLKLSPDIVENPTDVSISRWRRSHVRTEVERLGSLVNSGEEDDESSERLNSQLSESLASAAARRRLDSLILDEHPLLSLPSIPSIDTGYMDLAQPSSDAGQTMQQEDPNLARSDQDNGPYAFQSLDTSSGVQPQSVQTAATFPCAWPQILDRYFHYTHSWLPLSEKHELLRIAYSLPNNEFPVNFDTRSSCGETVFLAAVFAYTLSKDQNVSRTVGSNARNEEALCLLSLVKGMLDSSRDTYDLGHVRALLLLTLIHIDENEWKLAWLTVGRAIYIMVSLYNVTGSTNLAAVLDEGQRRTILACFALETLVATRTQRRTYLKYSDIPRIGMLSTDTMEEWEPCHESVDSSSNRASGQQVALGHVPSIFNDFVHVLGMLGDFQSNMTKPGFQDTAARFRSWKDHFHGCHGTNSCLHDSPQLLNLRLAASTTQSALEMEVTGTISPNSLEELVTSMETITNISQGRDVATGFAIPPSLDAYLFIVDSYLKRGSMKEAMGQRGLVFRLQGMIRDLRRYRLQGCCEDLISNVEGQCSRLDLSCTNSHPADINVPENFMQAHSSETEIWSANDDDMLFDSLASLDSGDWLSNLPDFYRNLGGPRGASPDLQALIDGAF